jgi:hypothetical protein
MHSFLQIFTTDRYPGRDSRARSRWLRCQTLFLPWNASSACNIGFFFFSLSHHLLQHSQISRPRPQQRHRRLKRLRRALTRSPHSAPSASPAPPTTSPPITTTTSLAHRWRDFLHSSTQPNTPQSIPLEPRRRNFNLLRGSSSIRTVEVAAGRKKNVSGLHPSLDIVEINIFAENLCFPSQRSRSGPRRGSCSCSCATCEWQSSWQFCASRSTTARVGHTSVSSATDRKRDARLEWWNGRYFLRSELLRILLWSSSSPGHLASVMRSFATLASYLSLDAVSFTDYFAQAMHLVNVVWYLSDPGDESHPTSQVYIINISAIFISDVCLRDVILVRCLCRAEDWVHVLQDR